MVELTTMATISETANYPTSDGKPMAETDVHRRSMVDLIDSLQDYYAEDPLTYVSGDLLMFYERGNKRRHLAPDVFVVRGVPRHDRLNYLLWEEGKGPDLVIEVTSKSTRKEDLTTKRTLYRDTLLVSEYFLFDPLAEYLRPQLQGFRLVDGEYVAIRTVEGRLPSMFTGLHFEAHGHELRLYNPTLGRWLPTPMEKVIEAEAARRAAEAKSREAEAARRAAEAKSREAETELERLRKELEALRRAAKGSE
jgi:Uma2 family endonuclease